MASASMYFFYVLLPVRLVFYYYAYLEWPGQRVGALRELRRAGRRAPGSSAAPRANSQVICEVDGATLDDLREAVTTLEGAERIGAHPDTVEIESDLRHARAALAAREGGDVRIHVFICGPDAIADRAKE